MNSFAERIMQQKYSHTNKNGDLETWNNIAYRVTKHVMKSVGENKSTIAEIEKAIREMKFIPAGRYLYSAGLPYHQTQNCFGGETRVVTREGIRTIKELSDLDNCILQTTQGHWAESQVKCFGEQQLYKITLSKNNITKVIRATAGRSWRTCKKTNKNRCCSKMEKTTVDLKVNDIMWQVSGFGIERTPISKIGIMHGIVYGDGNVPKTEMGFNTANVRLCGNKKHDLEKYFVDYASRPIGEDVEISGLPRFFKERPSLTWDRSYLLGWLIGYIATDGCVSKTGMCTLSSANLDNLLFVKDVCYLIGISTGAVSSQERISNLNGKLSSIHNISFSRSCLNSDFFINSSHKNKFINAPTQRETETHWKVISVEKTEDIEPVYCAVVPETHEFVLEDGILTGNCLALRAEDSREGWADLLHKASMALMTGAGIGVNYSDVRGEGKKIRRTGGTATGSVALMQMVNEVGRGIMQGGSRRSAIWAGLNWKHSDILKFISCKNNNEKYLDGTNISVCLDNDFFKAYDNEKHPQHNLAYQIYWAVIESMCKNGEPGFSVDVGNNSEETLRNACCEYTAIDDSDICNLGSINLANIKDATEFAELLELATRFLLAGTVYSDVPYAQVDKVRSKNRTIGIGLMGVHEFLLKQGAQYGNIKVLEPFLALYKETGKLGVTIANEYEINKPRKTRAIAPTGTIGIIAETSTGIEPLFCVAYKRRFMKGDSTYYQYVIDPTAKRLIDEGMSPDMIEDAYTLSHDIERRIAFQADMQEYVDMGISSTLNLPAWGSESNNEKTLRPFGNMLMKYLPRLRGITAYPDGGRSGQPLTPVAYSTACRHMDQLFVEGADICDITKKGSCNS